MFLDRDGVINRVLLRDGRPYSPATLDDLEFLPDVAEAIEAVRSAGFHVVVATNQPDVARGIQCLEVIEAMHDRILAELPIHDIKVCYHVDEDGCQCRKPKPGMLLKAAAERSIDLARSFMVGDRWRDIEAGKAAGCHTILVDGGYAERQAENPDAIVSSLLEASQVILSACLPGEKPEGDLCLT